MKRVSFLLLFVVFAFLYSCGGGGGGAIPPSAGGQQPPPSGGGGTPPVVQPSATSITISGLVQSLPPNYESSIISQQQANASYIDIADAVITAKSYCNNTETEMMVISDEQGKFSLPGLKVCAPGYVVLKAEKDGFVRFEKTIKFETADDLKDLSIQALIDPVNTKVIKVIDVSSPIYSQNIDDFVTIAVVQDKTNLKRQILTGEELKSKVRKNSNLEVVWQFDIRRSVLKQEGTESLIVNVKNYDPLNQEHMKKFPSDYDDKGNRLVTGGFDFLDIRKDDNTSLKLSPTSKSSISGQEFPEKYRFKRRIYGSLIKCDADATKPGLQIGFYALLAGSWKLVGYGTIYNTGGEVINNLSNIKSENDYYIVLTDEDLLIDIELFNYYNFDYVLSTCATYKTLNIKVDLVNGSGKNIDAWLYIYRGKNYLGYGKTNSLITTGYFTDNTEQISIYYYDPFTYQYVDVTKNTEACQPDYLTDPKHDEDTNFHYKCEVKVSDPYTCKVSGKFIREDNNPYKGVYVTSDVARWGVYTDENGAYTLDVKCGEKSFVKVYIYGEGYKNILSFNGYEDILSFNVNGTTDEKETADDREKAILPEVELSNQLPYVYIYYYQNTTKPGKSIKLSSYAYDPDGDKISYRWSDNCSGNFDNPNSASPTWTAPNSETKCTLTLEVKDSYGASKREIDIYVYNNRAPVISYIYASNTTINKGGNIQVYSYAYDLDGDKVSYDWKDDCGGSFDNPNSASPKWTAPGQKANCSLTLTVSDGDKEVTRSITINVGLSPVINSINVPSTANVGDELEFNIVASDADGDSLTYSWKIGGSEICNTASCKYKVQTTGTITVDVEVKDTDGNTAKASRTINVGKGANTEIKVQGRN